MCQSDEVRVERDPRRRWAARAARPSARSGAHARERLIGSRDPCGASPSGSGRQIDIHGAPSTISGAATVSSSTCWTMWTQKSFSASVVDRRDQRDRASSRARRRTTARASARGSAARPSRRIAATLAEHVQTRTRAARVRAETAGGRPAITRRSGQRCAAAARRTATTRSRARRSATPTGRTSVSGPAPEVDVGAGVAISARTALVI